jgi:ribosomal protein S18 acetylase RimI-like enzyme
MELRPATAADAPALAGLAIAFRNHLQRDLPTDDQFHASIAALVASGDAAFHLAVAEGAPVGYVLLRFRYSMWASGTEATIEDLFVNPAHRQRGAGRRLIQSALAEAARRDCATVCLDTNEHNQASTRIYTDLGFSAVSKRWQGRQLFYRLNLT